MQENLETLLDQFVWVNDADDLCRRVVHSPAGITGATSAAILEMQQDGSLPVCGSYGFKNQFAKILEVTDWFSHDAISKVIKTLEVLVLDVQQFFESNSGLDIEGFPGESLVLCPLVVKNNPAGVLLAALPNKASSYRKTPPPPADSKRSSAALQLCFWKFDS